jgi:acyl carrier protein
VVVERLPLTATGKVDRRALAVLADTDGTPVDAQPMGPIEQAVADIWSRALGTEVTRPDAEFIALGGHSLLALVVTDDIREELGVELGLADFFRTATVAGQAALLERALLEAHTELHPDVPEYADVH